MSNKKVLIIAEAGVNHNGDYEIAKKLIDAASEAGADFVKFQTFKASKIVNKSAKKADYQIKNINDGDNSQYEMLRKLEMSDQWHYDLIDYARDKNIAFLSTGFDEESIDFLDRLGMPFFKIPSGEITNKAYLEHIATKGKPVIISTGMADLSEIKAAMEVFLTGGIQKDDITILHCNTEYPTPMADVNLLAMNNIRDTFGVKIGYSDHTLGIEIPIAAVALGARVIEKHFTLDRSLPGPDHLASLEPLELKSMVESIRNVELAIAGSGIKELSKSEVKNKDVVRKSLHYAHDLMAGHIIATSDLISVRPGTGLSPMEIDKVIGMRLKRNVDSYNLVSLTDFE